MIEKERKTKTNKGAKTDDIAARNRYQKRKENVVANSGTRTNKIIAKYENIDFENSNAVTSQCL